MKKIMIAALGLSLLSGSVVFAQNTASTDTTAKKKHKKSKKSTATDTTSTATSK
jgi:hypothetical protein